MSKKKYYAFWPYDLYPFLLSAEVIRFNSDGSVNVKGYGVYAFKYKFLLPIKEGRALSDKLNELRANVRTEIEDINLKYQKLVRKELRGVRKLKKPITDK